MSIEKLLAELTTALNENTAALRAASAPNVVISSSTTAAVKEGGSTTKAAEKPAEKPVTKTTTKAAEKPAEKPVTKTTTKAAEKPAVKVSDKKYTDDDIRAIAKGYLGIDDLKLREQRKEWIVGLIGELGAAQAVQIPDNYRPAFDAWVQAATESGECPDYEPYVDGSYIDAGVADETGLDDDEV